ncbi:hypothetical protein [Reinekea sp. G2M2-21]|uniref:hypothetical protein n=1 Tax=Reinekea sp. G2M2-21 TaxID=2788942 RepID=UPI0018A95019|nr:hypothetical protein [Reinekea sp. G2M2-21]
MRSLVLAVLLLTTGSVFAEINRLVSLTELGLFNKLQLQCVEQIQDVFNRNTHYYWIVNSVAVDQSDEETWMCSMHISAIPADPETQSPLPDQLLQFRLSASQ